MYPEDVLTTRASCSMCGEWFEFCSCDDALIEIMGEAIANASAISCPRPMPLAYWEAECALVALRLAGYEVRVVTGLT